MINIYKEIAVVSDESGIHARPATILVQRAKKYKAEISIISGNKKANPKNLMSLLALGASYGMELEISAVGEDAFDAVKEIAESINIGLDSRHITSKPEKKNISLKPLIVGNDDNSINGISASPGIAFSNIYIFNEEKIPVRKNSSNILHEEKLLDNAILNAEKALNELYNKMLIESINEAPIFKAQIEILKDSSIRQNVGDMIMKNATAEWAWYTVLKNNADELKKVDDPIIQARSADIIDVQQRVISIIENRVLEPVFPDEPFILVAKELSPSQTAYLKNSPITGICTVVGGPNSHMAILSRALGLPALVGMGEKILEIKNGTLAILDSAGGKLYINPNEAIKEQAKKHILEWEKIKQEELKVRFEQAKTTDGVSIDVFCNIANVNDSKMVLERGGEGVGLLRTEFLFENRKTQPTQQEQLNSLRDIAKELKGKPFIIRTLDIGGDKSVDYLPTPKEENPFLGIRGIRLCFKFEDMFMDQLRAIYLLAKEQEDSGEKPSIWVMFPMIATLSELRKAKEFAEKARLEVNAPKIPLGIMVEVPSAAIIADVLAEEADFFSIGSNDLTQYTLAMDRMHPELAKDADSYHPSILKLISLTVAGAKKFNRVVGVCGNMAADPMMAALLIGLGVSELSVSPANVPGVKLFIRSNSFKDLEEKAKQALNAKDASFVKSLFN